MAPSSSGGIVASRVREGDAIADGLAGRRERVAPHSQMNCRSKCVTKTAATLKGMLIFIYRPRSMR
jgi:hypothetical protein